MREKERERAEGGALTAGIGMKGSLRRGEEKIKQREGREAQRSERECGREEIKKNDNYISIYFLSESERERVRERKRERDGDRGGREERKK